MSEIYRVSIQLHRPTGPNDPGAADWACYVVEGSTVVLTDKKGVALERKALPRRRGEPPPVMRWERKLRKGEDHLKAAKDLLWQRYGAGKKGSDFNRPLRYPPLGIV